MTNPQTFNDAVVGACPHWLGKSWVARTLCNWGFHTWCRWAENLKWENHIVCARCGVHRGW